MTDLPDNKAGNNQPVEDLPAAAPEDDLEAAFAALGTVSAAQAADLDDETDQADTEDEAPAGEVAEGANDAADDTEDGRDDPDPEADDAPAAQSEGLDPASSMLLKIALSLVIVLLVTTVSLVLFLTTQHEAPRTAVERSISAAEAGTLEHPDVADNWSKLAYAYAAAGRYNEALQAVRKGRNRTNQQYLTLVEADVLRSAGKYEDSIDAYNDAEKAVTKAIAAAATERKKMGVFVDVPDTTIARVYFGRALSEQSLGRNKEAIADIEKAIVVTPTQATLFIQLGDLYAAEGDRTRAAEAYNSALRFIPDSPEARAGLDRLQKGK
jgi:tetratricopeptide (TPR) repeat protein